MGWDGGYNERNSRFYAIDDFGETAMEIAKKIGEKIRYFRKKKHMTAAELAEAICKSKSAVSKYENGLIAVDILTLYDIAAVLEVPVQALLYSEPPAADPGQSPRGSGFIREGDRLYLYGYDGRVNRLFRTVIDVLAPVSERSYESMMYMNFESYEHYQNCENTYQGKINVYDAFCTMLFQNMDMEMDHYQIGLPSPYMKSTVKWALAFGISSRPLMPTAMKMLISKTMLKEDEELLQSLKVSKQDIRLLKHYNLFVVQ